MMSYDANKYEVDPLDQFDCVHNDHNGNCTLFIMKKEGNIRFVPCSTVLFNSPRLECTHYKQASKG